MFEPINARLASSCSRNGIRAADRNDLLRAHIHGYWILVRVHEGDSPCDGIGINHLQTAMAFVAALAWRSRIVAFFDGRQVIHFIGDHTVDTLRYGVSRKPYRWCGNTRPAS